jgi:membrane fusion protein (multidrug efflux system)
MKKNNLQLISSFFLLALLVNCGKKEEAPQGPAGSAPFEVTTVPVKTVTGYTSYPTSIEGIVNSEVRAKISGYITEVLVDEGKHVNRGQDLFKLETQLLNQDASAAKANVNVAQVEVDKLKPLVEKNIISNVQLESAKAKLQQAKSAYNSIRANINYGVIKSPVDGYVGLINLRRGALVSPTSQEPLTTVSQISKVYAYFSMNEKDYLNFLQNSKGKTIEDKIKFLPKVTLVLVNGSDYEKKGTIETINSQVNAKTGSVTFRAVFDNPSRLLTNGNSGTIKIPKIYEDAIVVPKESMYERQGSTYVYKVGKDNMAVSTPIIIVADIDNMFVVSEGVKVGDKIIATGLAKLRGDTKIKPIEVPFEGVSKPIKKVFR